MNEHNSAEENKTKDVMKDVMKEEYFSPLAVLAGAILISASILYVGAGWKSSPLQVGTTNTAGNDVANNPGGNAPAAVPRALVTVHDRSDAPVIGSKNAPLTMYEFSDFQCPYCTSFYKTTYPTLKTKYIDTGKLKIVYRHFPLSFHINAEKAAEAAECANRQGKFEPYYDLLFTNSKSDGGGLATADLKKYAGTLGLNTSSFNTCLDTAQTAGVVAGDEKDGQAAGVTGTPSFVLKGNKIEGALPLATFEQTIEAALK